jgi:hypothetical protein
MKADFTPAGGSLANLGDDSLKWAVVLEQLGRKIEEQVDALAFSAVVSRIPRGNAQGECVFTAAKSHASQDAAASFFATEVGRVNGQGSLVLTFTAHTLTMANAVLGSVEKVESRGVWWQIRYRFGITTVAYA